MICCNREMMFELRWDDAQVTDHAFNLYVCESCGKILKESLWNDPGIIEILLDNKIIKKSLDDK